MSDEIEEIKKKKIKELKNKKEKENKNMANGKPKKLTESNFQEFTKNNKKAVIDAWAEWCGPCKMLNPVIKELASEYKGKVAFGKLNVDENQNLAAKYGIRSIPTLLFFENGELVDQLTGAVPKQNLKQKINQTLL